MLPSIAKKTHSSKMAINCTIGVQLRRFKVHWKAPRILYTLVKDTKNQFEHFEDQTKLITEEMQNRSRKAKTEPTGEGRLTPYHPRHIQPRTASHHERKMHSLTPKTFIYFET
ncbi:hypothetical protein M9H77_13834 [Catharanthus roseus]|uniref:Uncharacterized protein n=1 Tax=Catharanthus roseus TaxID=4058 RepID=A0ACC0BLG9_CATRO|nr:hypothetical protein M9H77_13834 [Catharanthus roseus]